MDIDYITWLCEQIEKNLDEAQEIIDRMLKEYEDE